MVKVIFLMHVWRVGIPKQLKSLGHTTDIEFTPWVKRGEIWERWLFTKAIKVLHLFMKQVTCPIKGSTIKRTQVELVFLLVSFAFVSWDRRNTYKNNAWEENITMISVCLCTNYTGLLKVHDTEASVTLWVVRELKNPRGNWILVLTPQGLLLPLLSP